MTVCMTVGAALARKQNKHTEIQTQERGQQTLCQRTGWHWGVARDRAVIPVPYEIWSLPRFVHLWPLALGPLVPLVPWPFCPLVPWPFGPFFHRIIVSLKNIENSLFINLTVYLWKVKAMTHNLVSQRCARSVRIFCAPGKPKQSL